MSITDELREFADGADGYELWCPRHKTELLAIADRIDAEHQKADDEWKAKGGQSWLHGYDECRAELMEGNEAIAACLEEAGWVQLPKDADGVPIHVGDRLDGYDTTITVRELRLKESLWAIIDTNGDIWSNPCAFSHHVEPTVEDVLLECCKKYHSLLVESMSDAIDGLERDHPAPSRVIAEYAEKLRLADDGKEQ